MYCAIKEPALYLPLTCQILESRCRQFNRRDLPCNMAWAEVQQVMAVCVSCVFTTEGRVVSM